MKNKNKYLFNKLIQVTCIFLGGTFFGFALVFNKYDDIHYKLLYIITLLAVILILHIGLSVKTED